MQDDLTAEIIAAAIEVHRHRGPGLLESTYLGCLCHELQQRKLKFESQKPLPLTYKGMSVQSAYRLDILVENRVIVEVKSVSELHPIHEAQFLSY